MADEQTYANIKRLVEENEECFKMMREYDEEIEELKKKNNELLLKETQTHNENVSLKSKIEELKEENEKWEADDESLTKVMSMVSKELGDDGCWSSVDDIYDIVKELKEKIEAYNTLTGIDTEDILAAANPDDDTKYTYKTCSEYEEDLYKREDEIEELKEEIKELKLCCDDITRCEEAFDKGLLTGELPLSCGVAADGGERYVRRQLEKETEELKEEIEKIKRVSGGARRCEFCSSQLNPESGSPSERMLRGATDSDCEDDADSQYA